MLRKKRNKKLTAGDRERVQDSMHFVQSARETLSQVDTASLPDREAIQECLDNADRSLRDALRTV